MIDLKKNFFHQQVKSCVTTYDNIQKNYNRSTR